MSKYLAAFTPYEVKSSLIRVTGYKERNIEGFIENPYFEKPRYFANLTQFMLIMEALSDDISYPQRLNENRAFSGSDDSEKRGEGVMPAESKAPENTADIATFKLNILFRQNSSWQGSILWLEKNLNAQFRSALELVMLLDSVLSDI